MNWNLQSFGAGAALLLGAALAGCGPGEAGREGGTLDRPALRAGQSLQEGVVAMQLTGPFENGQPMARKYTGEGEDLSPPLSWTGAPEGVRTFALICDDPDAPSPRRPSGQPWVHWVIYNIPGDTASLPEGVPRDANLSTPPGAMQGINSWGRGSCGYRGPLPPPGSGRHRYVFKIYALDASLSLPPAQADKQRLLDAMKDHILAQGELVGTYER